MPDGNWYIIFNRDIPLGAVAVTVTPAEASRLTLSANLGAKQEIGHYRQELPAKRLAEIRSTVRASNYKALPEPAPAPPSMPFVFLGEGSVGAPPAQNDSRSFPADPLPSALEPVVTLMRGVVDEIREHPWRVVSGEAVTTQPQMAANEGLTLIVRIKNIGTAPLLLANPAGALTDATVGLSLRIARDKPDDELQDDDVAQLEFARGAVRQVPPPGEQLEKPGLTLELEPGEELRLQLMRNVVLRPGRYRAVLTYHSQIDDADPERSVEGALLMAVRPFEISGQRK